jgi:beta-lactamase regulating signal transducer with metallopeptidase domain
MESVLTQVTDYLLTQSWQIALLVAVVAAVSLVLKNRSSHVRYMLWLIVLAKCLVPPLLTIPLAVLPEQKAPEPAVISVPPPTTEVVPERLEVVEFRDLRPVNITTEPVLTKPTVMDRLAEVTWRQWLGLGWIAGAGVFATAVLLKAWKTNRRLKRQRTPLSKQLEGEVDEFFGEVGVRTIPKVWFIEGVGQPFVWGLVRGAIYLPADCDKNNGSKDRRVVLGHELSHVVRFDAAVNLLQIVAQAAYWFHPFVWWANKRIREEREKCCDEMAIARLNAVPRDYSTAIVNTLVGGHAAQPVPSLAVAGPAKNLEDRIKTIMKSDKKFCRRPTFITVAVALILAAVIVPTTLALTERPEDIQTVVLEEFRKNRDKFKCGVLAWMLEERAFNPGTGQELETGGTFGLWWDGQRIATRFVADRIIIDREETTGEPESFSVEKQTGGDSFDGGFIPTKPHFEPDENWFELVRWSGTFPLDREVIEIAKLRHVAVKWSVIDTEAGKQAKLTMRDLEEGSSGLYYFNLSRRGNLVRREFYDSEGRLYFRQTVQLEQVVPRGWFPVELSMESVSPKEGKVTLSRRYALDMKRCSFNDRSAIPAGIFKSGPGRREKATKSLQEFAETRKLGTVDESDEEARRPREAVENFLAAALAAEYEQAQLHAHEKLGLDQVREFGELPQDQNLTIIAVYADDFSALALSSVVRVDSRQEGSVVFHLLKRIEDGQVKWLIHDIDLEPEETAEKDLTEFLNKHPEAKMIPERAAEPPWGEAVEAVRIRLRADRTVWTAGEVPKFEVDVRNDGSHQLQLAFHQDNLEFQVDGVWYRATIPWLADALRVPFGPGRQHDSLPLSLDPSFAWRSADRLLDLRPGRHAIRVALARGLTEDGEPISIRPVSNPVQIEILPEEAKPPVQVEKEREIRCTMGKIERLSEDKIGRVSEFAAAFAEGGQLNVANKNGSIGISGQETAECRVRATIEVGANSRQERNELMENVKVEVKPTEDGISVNVDHRRLHSGESVNVDFEITVPKHANVELTNGNGDIDISNITGHIGTATGNGSVALTETHGKVKLLVGNGQVTFNGTAFEKCQVSVGNGKITGRRISGDIKFDVGNGNVSVGYARNAPGAVNAEVAVAMGGIDFCGPDDLSAVVEATAAMGNVHATLPLKQSKSMMGGSVTGSVGKGQGKVRLVTSMGSVRIE